MGSQGQRPEKVKHELGQTLILRCSYNPQIYEMRWTTWCKWRENGGVCDRLITKNSVSLLEIWDPRASLQVDPYSGIITITMSKLRVEDSGIYSCGIYVSFSNTFEFIRTISLQVSPAPTLRTTKHSQTTTETPVTTSATPLVTSRDHQTFIIWGAALASLLLLGLLSAGIVYTVKISPKPRAGDDHHNIYDEPEAKDQKQKARDVTIEMQEEDSEVIQYALVVHGTQLSFGESIYANTQMEHNPVLTHIPNESVEYASIARTRCQLPR
ncbi:uncharacterized protein LOC122752894 isoform X2 [Dromiciops gliroides]|nr:uncharacterized protein LOC122752894 isoform X2 [Dromiciops gliroides]